MASTGVLLSLSTLLGWRSCQVEGPVLSVESDMYVSYRIGAFCSRETVDPAVSGVQCRYSPSAPEQVLWLAAAHVQWSDQSLRMYPRCSPHTRDGALPTSLKSRGSVSQSMAWKDLRITAKICDAFATALAACFLNLRSVSMKMPRSLSESELFSWTPFNV